MFFIIRFNDSFDSFFIIPVNYWHW
jgi:hypothetical protein